MAHKKKSPKPNKRRARIDNAVHKSATGRPLKRRYGKKK